MLSGAQTINTSNVTHDKTQSLSVSIANIRVLRFHSRGIEFVGTPGWRTLWSTSWPWKMEVWNCWSSEGAPCPRTLASSITCLW